MLISLPRALFPYLSILFKFVSTRNFTISHSDMCVFVELFGLSNSFKRELQARVSLSRRVHVFEYRMVFTRVYVCRPFERLREPWNLITRARSRTQFTDHRPDTLSGRFCLWKPHDWVEFARIIWFLRDHGLHEMNTVYKHTLRGQNSETENL